MNNFKLLFFYKKETDQKDWNSHNISDEKVKENFIVFFFFFFGFVFIVLFWSWNTWI